MQDPSPSQTATRKVLAATHTNIEANEMIVKEPRYIRVVDPERIAKWPPWPP